MIYHDSTMPALLEPLTQTAPTEADATAARHASRQLAQLLKGHEAETLPLRIGADDAAAVPVSGAALRVLVDVLEAMSKGHTVTVLSAEQELSPNEAAVYLGMSRPLLSRLLDDKEIPFRYVGAHKRIRFSDVAAFRTEQERRYQILDELTAQAQELNMGY